MLAKEQHTSSIYLPAIDACEAAVLKGLTVYPVLSLLALFHHLTKQKPIEPQPHKSFHQISEAQEFDFDLADIRGQEHVKRAL